MSLVGRTPGSRFATLTKPFFHAEVRWQALGLLGLLVALLLSVSGANVVNSYVGRDFMTAIAHCQAGRFSALALLYATVFAFSAVLAAFLRFTEERLRLLWRQWLTEHLTARYLAGRAYYWIKARGDIDNPDQRLAEDVKTFTTETLALVLILLNSAIGFCAFAGVLWSITPWLFLAAVGYAFFGSGMTAFLGRRLVGLDIIQLKKEADLRYDLIRVREHAEQVALARGELREKARLRWRVQELVNTSRVIIRLNRNLAFFTEGFNYLTQLIPLLIVGPLFIRGDLEFGQVTQAQMAFALVLNASSLIVREFQHITTFAAVVTRLGSVWEAFASRPEAGKPAIELAEDPRRVAFERLTLVSPGEGRLLVKELSVEVPRGRRLLILGPDATTRGALFRAAAGLWQEGEGRIRRPRPGGVMFLPQQPYLGHGCLRAQLGHAAGEGTAPEDRIRAVLRRLRLETVLDRVGGLDAVRPWAEILSLGEQQLLAFAGLLLSKPRFAFLDEATSALEPRRAHRLYRVLSRTAITYLSVSADPGLLAYHDRLLELHGDGAWKVTPRRPARRARAALATSWSSGEVWASL